MISGKISFFEHCGPSIDIASNIPQIKIDAITLSPTQANTAKKLIEESSLTERIQVHVGDYHKLPFADEKFDVVIFLESTGYSDDPQLLYSEAYRVLRPGGKLYIKDAFIKESQLSTLEKRELDDFNRVYVCKPTRMSDTVTSIASVGFENIISNDLEDIIDTEKATNAMFKTQNGQKVLSEFGLFHYRNCQCIPPIVFGEVKAYKPN